MLGGFFILDDPIFGGLAVSLIFGLLVSTILTLLVIPVVYYAYQWRKIGADSMIAIASGILVGLVLGLTGAGGSIFAVPLLVMGLGLDLTQATPIALLAVFGATAFGALSAQRAGHVCHRAALMIGIAGSVATPAGVYLASRASQHAIYLAFAAVMLIVASRLLLQTRSAPEATAAARDRDDESRAAVCRRDPRIAASELDISLHHRVSAEWYRNWNPVWSAGSWCGLCHRAFTTSGDLASHELRGGDFAPRHRDHQRQCVCSHLLHGNRIPWLVATPFLAGALVGMWAGRMLVARISGARLQQSFAALMAAAALAMAYRGI